MIKNDLTVSDMKMMIAIGDLFAAHPNKGISLQDMQAQLKEKGFPVGNGMSRELDDIESKIGGPESCGSLLLVRSKRGSKLTPRGLQIVNQFREVVERLNQIDETVASPRTVVRIGLTNSLATNLFPRVLKETEFLKEHPEVDLEIVEAEPHELVNLLRDHVDFAVGPQEANNGFKSELLCVWKRVLLYNRTVTYSNRFHSSVDVETLREWLRHEVVLTPATPVIPKIHSFLKSMKKTGRRIVVPQAALRRRWVELGIGLAISYEEAYPGDSGVNDVISSIDLSKVLGTTAMHLYFDEKRKMSDAAKALKASINRLFNQNSGMTM